MKIYQISNNETIIFSPCGKGFLIQIRNKYKYFDNETTARNFISNFNY